MTERSNRPSRGRSRGGSSSGGSRGGRPPKKSGPSGPPPEELKPILEPPDIESFTEWELGDEIQGCLAEMGITEPTPVQKLAIGSVLEGRDVIAKAETGTGKTLAFGAPMMAKVEAGRSTVLGLVLAPTRELAQQVAQVLEKLGEARGIGVALVVGGDPMQPQIKKLQSGVQVVVGTPGRVLDLMKQRFLKFPWLEFAVLDEADEMLEIGFLPDVEKILEGTAEERQTLLFSATFPPALLALARKHTRNPVELATAKGVSTVDRITQRVVFLGEEDRPHVLKRLLMDSSPDELFLVFCDRRTEVDRLMRRLERLPVGIKALHGGYDQAARFRVMSAFRQGQVRALIATDVASRGLDVTGVTHVINFSPPRDISDYTHRIGRTGRAGRTGCAVTFVAGPDGRRWKDLERQMNWEVPEVGERDLSFEVLPNAKGRGRSGSRRDRSEEESSPRASREDSRPRRDRSPDRDREPRAEREPRRERTPREEREPRRERTPREDREPRRERTPRGDRSESQRSEPRRERSREDSRPRRSPRDEDRRPADDEAEAPRREPRRRRSSGRDEQPRANRDRSRSESDRSEAPRRSAHRDEPADRDEVEERPRRKVRTRSSHRNGGAQAPRRDEDAPARRRRRREAEEEAPRERGGRSRSEREPKARREPEEEPPRRRTRTRSRSTQEPQDSRSERNSGNRDREDPPRQNRPRWEERSRESELREERPRREPRERSTERGPEREPRNDRDEERPRRRRRSSPERSSERDEEPRRGRSWRNEPRSEERSSGDERPRKRSRPEEPDPREERPRRRRRSSSEDETRSEPRRDSNSGDSGPRRRKRRGSKDSPPPSDDDGFGVGV